MCVVPHPAVTRCCCSGFLVDAQVSSACPGVVDGASLGTVDLAAGKVHGDHMTDLQALIRSCNDRGVSYREMERRAADAGHRVKFQTFADYANKAPLSFPKSIGTIRGMAAALDVTERAVVLAYAESLGVDVGQIGFADLVPLNADEMTTGMRSAVLAVIREATKGADNAASQEPGTEARGTAEQSAAAIRMRMEAEAAASAARLSHNNRATGRRGRRGLGPEVSGSDDTTTDGKRA